MPRKRGRDSSPSPSFSLAQSVRSAGTQVGTQGGGTQGGGTQSDAKQNEPLDFGLVDEALTQAATQDYVFQALPEEADVIEEPEASDCVDERKEEDEISLDVHDLSKEIRALSISLSQQVRAKTLPTLKAPFLPPIPVLHEWFQGFESNGVYQLDAHESPLLAFLLFRAYAEFLVAGQNVPVLFADGVFPKEEGFSPIMAQNTCLLGQLDCLDCPDGPDSEQTLLARMRHHGYNHLVVVNVQTATELNLLMTLSKDLEQTVFATSTQEVPFLLFYLFCLPSRCSSTHSRCEIEDTFTRMGVLGACPQSGARFAREAASIPERCRVQPKTTTTLFFECGRSMIAKRSTWAFRAWTARAHTRR